MYRKTHLEHSEASLEKTVKRSSGLIIKKLAAKKLHTEQGEDEDEETQENQQGHDGGDGVDQRLDEVTHSGPVFGHFEASQETDTSEHRQTDGGNDLVLDQEVLSYWAQDDKEVKFVEKWHHVAAEAQRVHLQQHLKGEEADKGEVSVLLEVIEPLWLAVVLRGENYRIEEHKGQDEPEHELRLADVFNSPLILAIPSKMIKFYFSVRSIK